jgi:hypothetical protein
MAAVRSEVGDRVGLAAQSAAMAAQTLDDPRFNYFAAVSALAARDYHAVLALAERAAADDTLKVESAYLTGWARIHSRDPEGAVTAMRMVAESKDSPSAQHARAILGAIRFHQGAGAEAVQWWQALNPERRSAWNLAEPLQKSLFVVGLQALKNNQFDRAADKFREAGRAGLRDNALGSLIHYALVKAALQLLDHKGEG